MFLVNRFPNILVAIGTSSGGFSALAELVRQFNKEMDAAFFVVMHVSKSGIGGYVVNRNSAARRRCKKILLLIVIEVEKSIPIKRGTIYFANANNHLIVQKENVVPGFGLLKTTGCLP